MMKVRPEIIIRMLVVSGSVAAATVAAAAIHRLLPLANLSLVFLVPVLFSGVRFGPWPAFVAALLGVSCYNFFFTIPRFSFNVNDYDDIMTLGFFMLVAFVTGNMAARLNKQIEELHNAARRNSQLLKDREEAQIRAETERLRAALLSSVSHDLRTPLASIIGSVTTITEIGDKLSPQDRQELLGTVLSEAQRLNGFIQNLLDMTRIGQGKLAPRCEWTEFREILGQVLGRMKQNLSGFTIKIDDVRADLTLNVDSVLMQQVFVNILDNASKYAPKGTAIHIGYRQNETGAGIISITDQGPGIPLADRTNIFDMFYRVRAGDTRVAGTGLGLAICKGIIEIHNGTIHAEQASPHGGTMIIITLPPHLIGQADHNFAERSGNDD